MGERVAEIKTPGYDPESIGWVVYQSTAMAMFSPIFTNQLAAELFAATLKEIYPLWTDKTEQELAHRVNSYLTSCFGEQPEYHEQYNEYIESLDGDMEMFDTLRHQFISGWLPGWYEKAMAR